MCCCFAVRWRRPLKMLLLTRKCESTVNKIYILNYLKLSRGAELYDNKTNKTKKKVELASCICLDSKERP
jgi:hypothetical protein